MERNDADNALPDSTSLSVVDSALVVPASYRCPGCSNSELLTEILGNKVMLLAYALSVVILSLGLVALAITLSVLVFWYPDRGNAFVILLGGPLAALLVVHSKNARDLTLKLLGKNGNGQH